MNFMKPGVFYLKKMMNFMKPGVFYLQKMMNFMKMRTFYKKLPLFIKNSILHTYKKLKPQIWAFIKKNSIFGTFRDPWVGKSTTKNVSIFRSVSTSTFNQIRFLRFNFKFLCSVGPVWNPGVGLTENIYRKIWSKLWDLFMQEKAPERFSRKIFLQNLFTKNLYTGFVKEKSPGRIF